ncbi:uncharacterized protein LOC120427657 [Culex pipiens pallens]|uniref:uncharacterized protein LOC120427657 n=1 Tax=Culex pipiens pallens TaxID=42434 RepID=UPI001952FF76|nr:uncharacterized protein LOC120427657 [Culex pipiens pallens]XP_052567478.1 uncharacterized protein LOC120427657 [Culex pipiens pallens]
MVRPPGHGHQGGSSADGCQRRMISRGPIAAPTTVALYPDSASANGSTVVRIRKNSQASELSPFGNSRFPQQQKKRPVRRSSAWSPVAQNHASNYLLAQLLNKNQQSEILRRMKNAEADTNQLQQQLASQQLRIPIPQELQFHIQSNTQNVLLQDQRRMLYE